MKIELLQEKRKIYLLNSVVRSIAGLFIIGFFMMCIPIEAVSKDISPENEKISLTEALYRISVEYQVFFSYDQEAVKDVVVHYEPDRYENVEHALDRMLTGTALHYRMFNNRYIILYESHPEAINSLKDMVQHLESVIDKEEKAPMRKLAPPLVALPARTNSFSVQKIAFSVSGTVTDQEGEPLIGVNIQVKDSSKGTATDFDGHFTLEDIDENAVLVVSYVGYQTKEITVAGKSNLDIVMISDSQLLDEVVVVGYGTQTKKEITGAVSSVDSRDFTKGFASDAGQLIRGKVPGLAVVTPNGNPVSGSQLNLRGITTLSGSTQPLVLIDGVPGNLSTISPNNIASIDVLKDGSAAAIYGTRGTNGVILITTKDGTSGMEPKVTLRIDHTFQKLARTLDFMNATQYRKLVSENRPGAIDYGADNNWLNAVTQSPISQDYSLSISGGNSQTNYYLDLTYRNLNGVIKKSDNVLLYPDLRINHTMFNEIVKFEGSISGYEQYYFSGSDGGSYNSGVYKNGLTYNPTDPFKDNEGYWTEHTDKTDYMNPLALLEETHGKNQNTNFRTYGAITIYPLNSLNFRMLTSRNILNSVSGYSETKQHYSNKRDGRNGFASRGTTRNVEDMLELTTTYSKQMRSHNITGLIGYSWINNNYQDYWMQNWDFPTDAFTYNNMNAGSALRDGEAPVSSTQTSNKLIGYFMRLNYTYGGKYLLSASVRREGSSKFGEDNKFGNFPAISVGWNVSEENFLKSMNYISDLKLRGGFGVTGTEPSDPYKSLRILNFNQFAYLNNEWLQTPTPSQNPNPDLRWEKKEESNIGIDFGIFDNRITGTLDLYKRVTKDLLFNYPVAQPPYQYNTIFANAASMENKGVELGISSDVIKNQNFNWHSSVNFSTNKNKLLSLSDKNFQLASGYFDAGNTGEPIQQPTHRIKIGEPIGNFWGFKSVDIDEKGHWIIEGIVDDQPGESKPISQQTADDKQILGNGLPKKYLNWNNDFVYRNFDVNVTMRGAFDFQILNMNKLFYSAPVMLTRGNLMTNAYDEIYGKYPLADDQELQYVSYYIENGDYWKIDNITIGYSFDIKSNYIESLRIFGATTNVATFTKYSGVDPELNILGMNPGVDDKYDYPSTSSISFGINITF